MIDVIFADHQELFLVGMAEIVVGSDDMCLGPAAICRTVAENPGNVHTSRTGPINELSVDVFEDPTSVEAAPDCLAATRRGQRSGRLCAMVASTGRGLSFDGWAYSRGCDAPSSSR